MKPTKSTRHKQTCVRYFGWNTLRNKNLDDEADEIVVVIIIIIIIIIIIY